MEVEVRALVKNKIDLEQKLRDKGAVLIGSADITDVYFCKKDFSSFQEIEMHAVGSYALRVRKLIQDNKVRSTLNAKVISKEGDHNAWQEYEIEVSDFDESRAILTATEFKPYFSLHKIRTTYALSDMKVCIEEIDDFGCAVEIEIMTTRGDEERAKNDIFDTLLSLGVETSTILQKSITNLLMKERAFKQTL